jgi:serine/threonine protein kinase
MRDFIEPTTDDAKSTVTVGKTENSLTSVPQTFFDLLRGVLGPKGAEQAIRHGMSSNHIGRYTIRLAPNPEGGENWVELGSGGQAVVFLAVHPNLGHTVALKVLGLRGLASEVERDYFLAEGRTIAAMKHPNIVVVHDADVNDGMLLLAMEYCEEGSLAKWIETLPANQVLPVDWVVELMASVAEGVAHAHARGILHRDLKPANILLVNAPVPNHSARHKAKSLWPPLFTPKVADFGLAFLVNSAEAREFQGEAGVGTVAYMSPEQCITGKVSPASDVYSLGATLYQLLAGRPPFQGKRSEIVERLKSLEKPTALQSLAPHTPIELVRICEKCLSQAPEDRYANAGEFALRLRGFLKSRAERRTRKRLGLVGTAILIPLLAIAAFFVSRMFRDSHQTMLAQRVASAEVGELPGLVAQLDVRNSRVRSHLEGLLKSTNPSTSRNAAMLLSATHPAARPLALESLVTAAPAEISPLATCLGGRYPGLVEELTEIALTPQTHADSEIKEAADRRRANAACGMMLLGRPENVWGLLRFDPDPQLRSILIHLLGPAGVDSEILFSRIGVEAEPTIRRALVLALGEISESRWDPQRRDEGERWLLERYEYDVDAGFHAATKWLLGLWSGRPGGEQLATARDAIDNRLAGVDRPDFGWRLSKQKLTMVRVRQRDGSYIEICDSEITVGLFLEFKPTHSYLTEPCPTKEHPINSVCFEDAKAFCRWLSEREGLPPDRGYRLPTVDEFLTASLAGAQTTRYYGDSQFLLRAYARYLWDDKLLAAPVGSLKPNDSGLFDTLGNVSDLCFDPDAQPHFHARALGGSAAHNSFGVTCAMGELDGPDSRPMPTQGFRISRSLR